MVLFRPSKGTSEFAEQLCPKQRDALHIFREKTKRGDFTFENSACLCGRLDGHMVACEDRYALPVKTYLCGNCGMMRTSPRMTRKSLERFYAEDYRAIYVGSAQPSEAFFDAQVQHGEAIYRFIAPLIHSAPSSTVFDVGCGSGGTLIPFSNAGWCAFGCDPGSDYLERGKSAGLVLEHGGVRALSEYGPANLVMLSHVLEHLPDPLDSLEEIAQVLAKDGYVYIELPGIFAIHRTYRDSMLFLQNAHLYHYTLTTLASLMSRAGYSLVQGDESIRALFRKDDGVPAVSTAGEYRKVLAYLYGAELLRLTGLHSVVLNPLNFMRRARWLATTTIRRTIGDRLANDLKARLRRPNT